MLKKRDNLRWKDFAILSRLQDINREIVQNLRSFCKKKFLWMKV